ncbi:MAG: hypothetical protein KJN70_03510, partial [Eudoraea sp.]|nr:hypothetical protein [Eudoraea sp.]
PWFSIQTTGNGEMRVKEDNVTVKIHSARINGTSKIVDQRKLTELQVGVAYYKSKDNWLVSSLSTPKHINTMVDKNTNINVPSFETSFTVPKDILNQEHWVVLQMTLVDSSGKQYFVFTHVPD